MQSSLRVFFSTVLFFSVMPIAVAETSIEVLEQAAMDLVTKYADELKPNLKAAMQKGGPVEAIKVCSEQAPDIAKKLSAETGWQIKRVSLKPRNASTAVADRWEKMVLMDFEDLAKEHKDEVMLRSSVVVDGTFRFMQAQRIEGLCLACHGQNVDANTMAALKEYYPNDKAQGYELGDVRGAFSLSKKL